jgi:hypothetical protein
MPIPDPAGFLQPQCGHTLALKETVFLHSLQVVMDILQSRPGKI